MADPRPQLVVTRGLPGSGKTTYARRWVAEDRANRIRVNRDDLRGMFDDGVFAAGVTEPRIIIARDAIITACLAAGISVIVDETALPERVVDSLREIAQAWSAELVVADFRDVPIRECIRRDAQRERPLGADVIREVARDGTARSAEVRDG